MWRGKWRWLGALFATVCLTGCKATPSAPPYPPDPLFVSKKPVEGRSAHAPSVTIVAIDSISPPLPPNAVVSRSSPAARRPLPPTPPPVAPE